MLELLQQHFSLLLLCLAPFIPLLLQPFPFRFSVIALARLRAFTSIKTVKFNFAFTSEEL